MKIDEIFVEFVVFIGFIDFLIFGKFEIVFSKYWINLGDLFIYVLNKIVFLDFEIW